MIPPAPLRLRLDGDALVANWRTMARTGGSAACGAAVKADGYGLGAREVVTRLAAAGCRDFFVATWAEAAAIADLGVPISVLHGIRAEDMAIARSWPNVRTVLSTAQQVRRWRDTGGGPCDVMVDTGMNRLGLTQAEAGSGLLNGLQTETLMSHLSCADEDHPLNGLQLDRFRALRSAVSARRYSLANSGGVFLGRDYAFDLTRPGLAIYGGIPRASAVGVIRAVVVPEAQVLQRRRVIAGEGVGYNATFVTEGPMELAVVNLGYADGYLRGFSNVGAVRVGDVVCPVRGRVSMDLTIVDVTAIPSVAEGDWLAIDYDLPSASRVSGLSQYELLTGLRSRFDRIWD